MKTYASLYSQRSRSLWVALTVAVVMSLVLVACGGSTTTAAPTPTTAPTLAPTPTPTTAPTPTPTPVVHTVKIAEMSERYSFQPATLTIKVGDVVAWNNVSDAPHTVTSDTGAFNTTSNITPHKTFMFTFIQAGTFKYHCTVHPYMHATIIVTS